MEDNVEEDETIQRIRREGLREIPFRREDERYRHPEVIEKKQSNVVVVNIRDVSGSMRETKRELVERTFTPLDWYLTGKYDHAEFVYIAHDADAWEVERDEFFGIRSGGGRESPRVRARRRSARRGVPVARVEPLRLRRGRLRELLERHERAGRPAHAGDRREPPRLRGDPARRDRNQRNPRRGGRTEPRRAG